MTDYRKNLSVQVLKHTKNIKNHKENSMVQVPNFNKWNKTAQRQHLGCKKLANERKE